MEIRNTFDVPSSLSETWALMSDLPRIAPCMPGAQIDGAVAGEPGAYSGFFAMKVGPVRAKYGGVLRIQEMDEAAGRVVLSGSGSDAGGAGAVSATITGHLSEAGDHTRVELDSIIDVSGRLAQFTGRSSMVQGIADQIIKQFSNNLIAHVRGADSEMKSGQGVPISGRGTRPKGGSPYPPSPQVNELDGLSLLVSTVRSQFDLRLLVALGIGLGLGAAITARRRQPPSLAPVVILSRRDIDYSELWRGLAT